MNTDGMFLYPERSFLLIGTRVIDGQRVVNWFDTQEELLETVAEYKKNGGITIDDCIQIGSYRDVDFE